MTTKMENPEYMNDEIEEMPCPQYTPLIEKNAQDHMKMLENMFMGSIDSINVTKQHIPNKNMCENDTIREELFYDGAQESINDLIGLYNPEKKYNFNLIQYPINLFTGGRKMSEKKDFNFFEKMSIKLGIHTIVKIALERKDLLEEIEIKFFHALAKKHGLCIDEIMEEINIKHMLETVLKQHEYSCAFTCNPEPDQT
jgi:hypothetical protein